MVGFRGTRHICSAPFLPPMDFMPSKLEKPILSMRQCTGKGQPNIYWDSTMFLIGKPLNDFIHFFGRGRKNAV
jgi:hypothetical protein